MDASLALRLDSRSPAYDSELFNKLARVARDYSTSGVNTLAYYLGDLDICNDSLNCFGPTLKKDFEKRDRFAPENFIHPMTATEMWTLATFVSQILFGGETARRVEPRNPEDESKADIINEVLRWNDNQQDTYGQGFQWCLDSINANRGVMYDHWKEIVTVDLEPVEYEMPWIPPGRDKSGKPAKDPETGKPYKKPKDYKGKVVTRYRKVRKVIGGFTKIESISPYDFINDPAFPTPRFQEGRFAGHRVNIAWSELKRRSELDPEDYQYVLPAVVERLKNSKSKKVTSVGKGATTSTSRSFYERQRRTQPVTTITGSDKIDKEDGGVVECFCIEARLRPATYNIFEEDTEEELIEFLLSGEQDLLAVNIMTNKHDQYPYAVGEGRPNAHMQFGPSWSMIIRGPQAYIDYLAARHRESLARTSGNIFAGYSSLIDFEDFTDPTKDGLFIPLTEQGEASGRPIGDILKQIPIVDTTANFYAEMENWQKTCEEATGAHAPIQGAKEEGDPTATEFLGTQQMAQGRISTVARLLSSGALVRQTDRIVGNLQQFLPDEMVIRISGQPDAFDPDKPREKFMTVIRDVAAFKDAEGNPLPKLGPDGNPIIDPTTGKPIPDERALGDDITGDFDTVPHDGSLPGTDAKKVAALSRAVEAFSSNPMLAPAFDRTRPGAVDPIKLFQKLMRAIALPTDGIIVTREEAMKNQQEQLLAMGGGLGMPAPQSDATVPPTGEPAPLMTTASGNIPSAAVLPPTPTAMPPGPHPATS